jgi:hypothetical protein
MGLACLSSPSKLLNDLTLGTPLKLSRMADGHSPEYGVVMKGKDKENWMHLCEQAASEQDGAKLMELVAEINRLLDAKQHRLDAQRIPTASDTATET